jgi:AraC-like DNA-binding protein
VQRLAANTILLTRDHIVFDGVLGALTSHSHSTAALLIGIEGPFRIASGAFIEPGPAEREVRLALVPAAIEHRLDFHGQRLLAVYLEPHDPRYANLHRKNAGHCLVEPELDPEWLAALEAWLGEQRFEPLAELTFARFGVAGMRFDARLMRVLSQFSRGSLLDASSEELANTLRVSSSRFVHLFSAQLGTGLRQIKQYYRFKVASSAVARGATLTAAAHEAGFADSAHFSRAFSETFGVTPSAVLLGQTRWLTRD